MVRTEDILHSGLCFWVAKAWILFPRCLFLVHLPRNQLCSFITHRVPRLPAPHAPRQACVKHQFILTLTQDNSVVGKGGEDLKVYPLLPILSTEGLCELVPVHTAMLEHTFYLLPIHNVERAICLWHRTVCHLSWQSASLGKLLCTVIPCGFSSNRQEACPVHLPVRTENWCRLSPS